MAVNFESIAASVLPPVVLHERPAPRAYERFPDDDDLSPDPPPPAPDPIDLVEEMSRNPAKVSDWMGEVACSVTPPDRVIDFNALMVWQGAVTFEGLMTAIVGGDNDQKLKAAHLLAESFQEWARDRVEAV